MPRPRLFLIDTYGFIFRAYHARAKSGAPPMRTSKGLSTEAVFIFSGLLRRLMNTYKPEYIAAIMESDTQLHREQAYTEYKANRSEMPPDLKDQIPYIKRFLEAIRIPMLRYSGYEADDVIATIARRAVEQEMDVVIVSSDKDLLQLVDEHTQMLNPMKDDTWYDPAKVEEFMGVPPHQVADLLALKGDSVDNIPGAPGIGDKGARDLIAQFGSVEELLNRAAEVTKKTYRESLLANREQVEMSKRLATVHTDLPVEWSPDAVKCCPPATEELKELYRELEFYSMMKDLGPSEDSGPRDYAVLETPAAIQEYLATIPATALVAVAVQSTGKGSLAMTNIGLSSEAGQGRSLSAEHISELKAFLEDPARPKATHDLKSLLTFASQRGIELQGFVDDLMLYAFLLTSEPMSGELESLAARFLDRKLTAGVEESAACILELVEKLKPEVSAKGLRHLYDQVDFPLVPVLSRIERRGIRVETEQLKVLSTRMDTEIQRLAAEIYHLADKTFNINSPQQLSKVLFEDLALPSPVKYGKGKTTSTAADVLEGLAEQYPIAGLVLEYRQLTKLKGTYVDALPTLLDENGRVHTTFNMAVASTGRLSSSNPNLQNIPIRTELGREIRAAFVPRPGWVLIAADYSQIELRLLAHMSQDPVLVDAFTRNQDIHARTAAEVFGVEPAHVTSDMRRVAKTVNFGVIYGQTGFGLAKTLGIDRKEADRYIESYFQVYAGVKRYIQETIETARQTGACATLLGRHRTIPDMLSRNPSARTFAERTAVNSPIQGSAADLIKLAMIELERDLSSEKYQAEMLLQVHDELLFEAPPAEVDDLKTLVKHRMEKVYDLTVPLVVDVGSGPSWRDAK